MPGRRMRRRKGADADGEQVHVKESDLTPGVEGWGET